MRPLRINEAEKLVGVTKRNIRYYETEGLLSPGRETGNGYRDYTQADVDALRRIKLLRKLDLPLEEIGSGEELAMQSPIHDLSWYAAADRSNDNARLLAGYMTGVGMNGLSSEWWHFQDDATKGAIGLKASLYQGVSPEGWVQDDAGWRYRDRDGSFLRDAAVTIDGRRYTFGHDGYAAG